MLHQILFIFQFTCLKLIVNYCIKHGALYVNDLYIHWATIYILSWTTKKHQKILSRLLHSKLKKIQALFKDLHRNLRTFQGKMEFKDFSRLCEPWICYINEKRPFLPQTSALWWSDKVSIELILFIQNISLILIG